MKLSALESENNAGKGLVAVIERLHAERHPDELSTASGLVDFAANLLDGVTEGVIEALLAMPAFKETKLKAVLQKAGANRFACVARCVDYAETLQNVNGWGAVQPQCSKWFSFLDTFSTTHCHHMCVSCFTRATQGVSRRLREIRDELDEIPFGGSVARLRSRRVCA